MPLSKLQLAAIHQAKARAGLNDAQYRTVLASIAGVYSSKDLTNEQFEQAMATFEAYAEQRGKAIGQDPSYWRTKLQAGGSRMSWKIAALYADYCELHPDDPSRYQLSGLIERVSGGRTRKVEFLVPREQWALIEALKKILAREGDGGRPPSAVSVPADPNIPF